MMQKWLFVLYNENMSSHVLNWGHIPNDMYLFFKLHSSILVYLKQLLILNKSYLVDGQWFENIRLNKGFFENLKKKIKSPIPKILWIMKGIYSFMFSFYFYQI